MADELEQARLRRELAKALPVVRQSPRDLLYRGVLANSKLTPEWAMPEGCIRAAELAGVHIVALVTVSEAGQGVAVEHLPALKTILDAHAEAA